MIPDYLTFIRYQDKRTFVFFFLVLLVTLAFYWRNNAFELMVGDAWAVSLLLAITLFNFINELRPYWMYSAALERVGLQYFHGKSCSAVEKKLASPLVVAALAVVVFWLLVSVCQLLPSALAAIACLLLLAQAFICLAYSISRSIIIRRMSDPSTQTIGKRHLNRYICQHTMLLFVVSLLSVIPLKRNPDFSLENGFLSPALMVAMLIVCAIVLSVNVFFSLPSKKYIFFGRLLGGDTDLNFTYRLPCVWLQRLPLPMKMLLLVLFQSLWIVMVGMLLTATGMPAPFELYYVLCSLPVVGFFYCHLYWRWHADFMMACDMFLRYNALETLNQTE